MIEESPVERKEELPAVTRPKSRKERRLEKRAAKLVERKDDTMANLTKKERRKIEENEERRRIRKEAKLAAEKARDERILRQKELDKEKEAEPNIEKKRSRPKNQPAQSKKKKTKRSEEELIQMENIYENLFNGHDETTGFTKCELGVQFKDILVGTGPPVQKHMLCQVKYVLTAYKTVGATKTKIVVDQSKSFRFRLGRGEVILGWDIGMNGMQVGGRRQLIIPPKAGYGSSDIGAGPGAMLYFDVTLLSC